MKPWMQRGLWIAGGVLVVFAVAFAAAVPPLLKNAIEQKGTALLGRQVSVKSISANPFSLSVTLNGVAIADAPPSQSPSSSQSDSRAPMLAIERALISLSSASLVHRAVVLDAVEVDGAHLRISRLAEQRFNFTDIIERFQARPKAPVADDSPARFALYNIQLRGGRIDFDDRLTRKQHQVTDLALGVPFVSSLPTHVEVKVQPLLSARVNGTPLEVRGETTPFDETFAASVRLKLDGLDVPTYLGFAPVPLNFTLPAGKLDTDLTISFRGASAARDGRPARAAEVVISGAAGLRELSLRAPRTAPQPLLSFATLQVRFAELAPLARRVVLDEVKLDRPEAWVGIGSDGALNWQRFAQTAVGPPVERQGAAPAAPARLPAAAAAAPAPWQVTVKTAALTGGTLHFSDNSSGKFTQEFQAIELRAQDISTVEGAAAGQIDLRGGLVPQGQVRLAGALALAPLQGELDYAADDVQLRAAARYLAQVIDGTLEGSTSIKGKLSVRKDSGALQLALRELEIEGRKLALRGPRDSGAQLDIARLALQGGELDLTGRSFKAANIVIDTPRVLAKRLADGQIGWQKMIKASAHQQAAAGTAKAADVVPVTAAQAEPTQAEPAQAKAAARPGEAPGDPKSAVTAAKPWDVTLAAIELINGSIGWEDASVAPVATFVLSSLAGTVRNVTAAGTTPMTVNLRGRSSGATRGQSGQSGQIGVDGTARLKPLQTDLRIDLRNLDLAPARSYLTPYLNAVFVRGELTSRSRLQLTAAPNPPNAPDAPAVPMRVRLDGGLRVANLQALNPDGDEDLLRWQALDIDRIALRLGEGPADVALGKITLSDFFARVIISAEGRLNLADVLHRRGDAGAASPEASNDAASALPGRETTATKEQRKPAPEQARQQSEPKKTSPAASDPAPAAARPRIRIERVELTRGNINFTDNFIRPNYTANLTDITGSVSSLASDAAEPATLQLAGSVDREAPVTIEGTLNPLAPKLFLDIKGATRGVDLPRFTPYAAKYAGYPIIKGKLTMEVSYRVDNDQLKANNRLFIDQLTFGERVESPTATKLPVLLAVSLLKNTRGEIDLNLPISGSLNDPKFSVGGVIVQVIVNLLAKVVTSPFTLLAAAFGSEAELGYVDFAPGSAQLGTTQLQRLETLAKALNDRPALRLDIIGRATTAADTQGAKQAQLDARLRAAKVRGQIRAGGASAAPASVTIEPAERATLLAAVYADDKAVKKPRNAVGIARTLPAPEMEQLMIESIAVTPAELRTLANARAAAVRDHLEQQGKVPRERLFLVEPKIDVADTAKEGGDAKTPSVPTRVDFSLK